MTRGWVNTREPTKTPNDNRHLFTGVRQQDIRLLLLLLRDTQVLLHFSRQSGGNQTTDVNIHCKETML